MANPIEIVIGSGSEFDPGAGATVFTIPALQGASFYVQRSGYGTMPTSTYEVNESGGFTLLDGLQTSGGEVWFVFTTQAASVDTAGYYSNGFNYNAVVTALENRIGFRQPLGTGVPSLSSAVTTSQSGRYFDDFHALITVENIKAVMPQIGASDANIITYLSQIRRAAIMRALNGVFPAPQVTDQPQFAFQRYGKNDQPETNTGLFVGYEINVADTADAAVQVDSLRLRMDGEATFNVYLFKDGIDSNYARIAEVTTEANSCTDVVLSGWILGRGKWYLGYFQSDLGGVKAYREQACEWAEGNMFCLKPMQAEGTGGITFDRENIAYPQPAHGLNIEISSFKDYTTAVRRKAAMFDELVGLSLAADVVEKILYSVRENKTERILKDQLTTAGIQMDLNGAAPISDSPTILGLKQRIERELKRVNQSFYRTPKSVVIDVD